MNRLIGRLLAGSFVLVSSAAWAGSCPFSADRQLDIDAAGLDRLALEIGSDDIKTTGVAGLARIEVRGRACASSQAALDGLQLTQRREGRGVVVVGVERGKSNTWFNTDNVSVDIEVRVPSTLPVALRLGSGDASFDRVASVDATVGSGDIDARDVDGAIIVSAGSGDVTLRNAGSLHVQRLGSGDIEASDIRGDARIDSASSGLLRLTKVGGNVDVGSVGSGDLKLRSVVGSVRVGSLGSGDIDVDDVGGDLIVESRGSGDIDHRGVKGKVDVPRER